MINDTETFEEWYAEQDVSGLGPGYKEIAKLAWDKGFDNGWVSAVEAYSVGEL